MGLLYVWPRAQVCRCRCCGVEEWAAARRELQEAMRRTWVGYWKLVRERAKKSHQHAEPGALRAAAVAGLAAAPLMPVKAQAVARGTSGAPVLMSIQQVSQERLPGLHEWCRCWRSSVHGCPLSPTVLARGMCASYIAE